MVNAGSVLEDDDQRGLAHFIEHMAFNGTEHFAKQELVDYLESIGMRFGADLNASTSFDETVYTAARCRPTSRSSSTRASQILEDWAHGVTFDTEEIDKERGVVIEEWRLGPGRRRRGWPTAVPGAVPGLALRGAAADRRPRRSLETFDARGADAASTTTGTGPT